LDPTSQEEGETRRDLNRKGGKIDRRHASNRAPFATRGADNRSSAAARSLAETTSGATPALCPLVDPRERVQQPHARDGAAGLDMPVVVPDAVQRERGAHLLHVHRILEILLVRKDEDGDLGQLLVLEQREELRLVERRPGKRAGQGEVRRFKELERGRKEG
jgi:hypothetical protein